MREIFDIYLGCVNCGIIKFYKLPFGVEFYDFTEADISESGQREYSHFTTKLDHTGAHIPVTCDNCGNAFLYRRDWEQEKLVKAAPPIQMPEKENEP